MEDRASSLNMDIYLCVGLGLGLAGFIFSEIWWIFGGTLIFVSPFLGAFMDDELEKRASKLHYVPITSRY